MTGRHPIGRMIAVALLALTVGLSGCSDDEPDRSQLVIGIGQFPEGFHPNLFAHVAQSLVLGATRRPLTTYDADWQLVCMLCEALPDEVAGTARPWVSPDGEEGWELDYTIRADAVWADGTPITTEDVVFTWEVGRHPESGVVVSELYTDIAKIEARDEKSFTLFTTKRTCDYQGINDFGLIPAHIDKPNFAEPREYRNRSAFETDTTNPGLYMGPFVISDIEFGSTITLERNPNWWGDEPSFDRVVFKIIENTAALEANLLSGDIDYIAGEDGVTLDQGLAFADKHGSAYDVVFKSGLIYEHIDVNLDNPILADVRVRRALLHAADRNGMSEELFKGRQPVAHGSINPLDAVYYDGIPKYEYDPERAAALLDEAGWSQMRGGVRHNAAGEPLVVEIMTTAGNRVRETVEQILQSNWADVGIDVRIRNEPARVFFGQTTRERRFPDLAMYAWVSSPEAIPLGTLHSTMIPSPDNNFSGQNYTGYDNPEMDEIIDRLQVECDEATQEELWNRLQELYATDLPALPLYFRANPFIMPKWLNGVEPTGHQYPSTLWIEHWSVAETG